MATNRLRAWILVGIGCVIVAVLSAGAVFFFYNGKPLPQLADKSRLSKSNEPPARIPPSGYTEYRNTRFHFSLFYPNTFTVSAQSEGGSAMTFTFEDAKTKRGFQIFVVRYTEPQITEERLKMDLPSGVMKDMRNITIAGATGASFISEAPGVGETAEVWFVRGGYLYEVSTLKELAPLVEQIMQTWEFVDPQ